MGVVVFLSACALTALVDLAGRWKEKRRDLRNEMMLDVLDSGIEPAPWRTGMYRVEVENGVRTIYTEWARFAGDLHDPVMIKVWKRATPSEIADYEARHGGIR